MLRVPVSLLVVPLAAVVLAGRLDAQAHGRTSFGGNAAIIVNTVSGSPDANLTTVITFQFSRYTGNRHLELGGSLSMFGNANTAGSSSTTINPSFRVNFNTSPLGRQQNLIAYGGLKFGISATAFDDGFGNTASNAAALYGFQIGTNMFVSTNAALNIEGDYDFSTTVDAFGGSVTTFTGTVSVGARFFF